MKLFRRPKAGEGGQHKHYARAVASYEARGKKEVPLMMGDRLLIDPGKSTSTSVFVKDLNSGVSGLVPVTADVIGTESDRGRVLGDFAAEAEGELTAEAGEEVVVLQVPYDIPNGWVLVALGAEIGFLPADFIQPIDSEEDELPATGDASNQPESNLDASTPRPASDAEAMGPVVVLEALAAFEAQEQSELSMHIGGTHSTHAAAAAACCCCH